MGGLAKGVGFGTSVVLLDAGIRGASKAINVGEVEEIDSDQSHSTGLVVVHNKGDNEGSPITTYVMAATTIILLVLMGPCLIKRIRRFRSKGKEVTYPDPIKSPSPPASLPIPRYPGNQDPDNGRRRAEDYSPTRLDTERGTGAVKREDLEEEAKQARKSKNRDSTRKLGPKDEEPRDVQET